MIKYLSIAIIDDETVARDIISSAVGKILTINNIENQIMTFSNIESYKEASKKAVFNLILLDIALEDEDGIAFANELCLKPEHPDFIFISSQTDRVFDAIPSRPFGFVRKDSFFKDIENVIMSYIEKQDNKTSSFYLQIKNGKNQSVIDIDQIIYIESFGSSQDFHFKGDSIMTIHSSMQTIDDKLSKFGFLRIHKSYLVNARCIKEFSSTKIVLQNGRSLPVGRYKKNEAFEKYADFVRNNIPISL